MTLAALFFQVTLAGLAIAVVMTPDTPLLFFTVLTLRLLAAIVAGGPASLWLGVGLFICIATALIDYHFWQRTWRVWLAVALLTLVSPNVTILVLGIITSVAAVSFANRLNHGYVAALERSLLNRAVELDLSDVEDLTTRTVMLVPSLYRLSGEEGFEVAHSVAHC